MTKQLHKSCWAAFLAAGLALMGASNAWADTVELTQPANGWRNSSGDRQPYTQEVHYPASIVSTQKDQSLLAQINGRVKKSTWNKSVGKLVVNGVQMPLRIEADGRFSRPYAFDSGSNSVEVISEKGAKARTQFYDSNVGKTTPRLRVVLSWDTDETDLDLHVISPSGAHTFYGNRVSQDGGALDVDVTTGFGPEIYSNASPEPGTYLIYVNYFGGGYGGQAQAITVAQISIITNENTPNERLQTFTVPMRAPGETVLVKSFVFSK